MQWVTDALRQDAGLTALVVNVEMPPEALLERVLARLSGVPLELIEERRTDDAAHGERLAVGFATLETFVPRLWFLRPPFEWAAIVRAMNAHPPGLLVLDYLQRIAPPGQADSERAAVSASMGIARQAAELGVGVLALSAVTRPGQGGYAGLGLGSFRESSEIEFGCDHAFMLAPDEDDEDTGNLVLRHLKARYGKRVDLPLRLRGDVMTFAVRDAGGPDADLRTRVTDVWASTNGTTKGGPHGE
jgi:hypothetical protein